MKRAIISVLAALALLSALAPLTAWQNTPTLGVLPDSGPALPATCVVGQIYFKTTATAGLNQCTPANTWTALATGAGSGTVNAGTTGQYAFYAGNGTAVSGGGPITTNVLAKGDATNALANSLLTDTGTTVTYTGTGGLTLNGTGNQFTSTQGTMTTSAPFITSTKTWNAGGVAFTDQLSNITCTAAATASIAAGWGTAGTQWQLKYGAANCATAQMLSPAGAVGNPAYSFSGSSNTGMYQASGLSFASSGAAVFNLGATNAKIPVGSVFGWSSTSDATVAADTGISRDAVGVVAIGTGAAASRAGLLLAGNSVFVTSNFTTSGVGTALENITGLTWTFPATALNYNFHCHLSYSQAVGAAAVAFGIKATTNNPTNIFANGTQQITAGPPATFTTGTLATLATQTATNIVSGTPGATATNYVTDLHGTLELPASAVSINIMVSTATAADLVTVLRGSYCALTP